MTRRALVMAVLALILAALVAWQYWPAGAPGPTASAPGASVPAAPPVEGLNPLSARSADSLAAWADHPLFAPDRLPPAAASPPAAMEVVAPALEVVPPAEPPPMQPVLQGVIVTPAPGAAYLGDGQGGASIFLRPGESALGLTLERVYPDHATFMGPDGELDLPLLPQMPVASDPGAAAAPDQAGGDTPGDAPADGGASDGGAAAPDGEAQP